MFTEAAPTFDGRYYRIHEVLNNPRPIRGRIPILIGGSGEKRTLKLVARYGDACNLFGDPDTVRHKLEVLERHCADVGRDPAEITKTVLLTVGDPAGAGGLVAPYRAVGVDGVVVNMRQVADLDAVAQAGKALREALD